MVSEPTVCLLGIDLHAVTEVRCVSILIDEVGAGRGGWIVTPNVDHLRRLVSELAFRELCANADLRVADGMPLIWASRLQGTPLPERVAGSNLIWSVCSAAAEHGHSVFFLGGDPGTAERAAAALKARFPALCVAGTYCPKPGFENEPRQVREVVEALFRSAPNIVFVALGSPKQEQFIKDLRGRLPASWWIGVGISFSFACGDVRRAPRWIQRLGFEWAHRMTQEPKRLFRRYVVDGIPFVGYLLVSSSCKGLRRIWRA
jgi:N-acetylglucosaminyldiphosphoundecaprenol N-acetyl-beta-D-mannosaminyltransferase